MARRRLSAIFCLLAVGTLPAQAEEPKESDSSFDVGSFEKKPFEINGYVESKWQHFLFDRDSALFGVNRYADRDKTGGDQFNETLHLEGTYRAGIATFHAAGEATGAWDDFGTTRDATLFEATMALQPDPGATLEIGKKALKWGKGYAWNPVGFVERPKDADDPTVAREGFTMITGDLIASFDGPVRTVGFTPVVVPVEGSVNEDFGSEDGFNFAAKLYLLAWDTDIDLMALAGDGKTTRYGFDFSRNVTTNFEVHGEWAFVNDSQRTVVQSGGLSRRVTEDAQNWLVGARYLTESDTTIIAEHYHQGTGFTTAESESFYDLAHGAVASGSPSLLSRALAASKAGYGRSTPGRDYVYLRVSQQEPFGVLYWTPALTSIVNAGDGSFSVTPELAYTGIENLDLRLRLGYLHGGRNDEFGEKQNDYRLELRVRYFF